MTMPMRLAAIAVLLSSLAPRALAQPPASLPAQPTSQPSVAAGAVLSLAEAMTEAVRHSPELATSRDALSAAEDVKRSAFGALLPRVDVNATYSRYNSPFALVLGMGAVMFPPITAREQTTEFEIVQATQPITGLYGIGETLAAQAENASAAHADLAASASDLTQRVTQAYVTWLLALRLRDVAQAEVQSTESHVEIAMTEAKAGVLSKLDVARAEVAADRARQDLITTTNQLETAKTALALLIGLDPGAEYQPDLAPFPDPPPVPTTDLAAAESQALGHRPELRALDARKDAAVDEAHAAWSALIPQVSAVAQYQRQRGVPFGFPPTQEYIGGVLTWNAWDWGQTFFRARAASAAERQLDDRLVALRDAIYLDVKRQVLNVHSAWQAMVVGRAAVDAASTAERFETDSYRQGVATTTDVLDATTELVRARTTYAQALYSYYQARADLEHAIGSSR